MNEFDLTIIADRLEAMEETIISRILDRIQYKQNSAVYSTDKILLNNASPLDYMHKLTEKIFAELGKFTVAEEKPFFKDTCLSANTADTSIVRKKEPFGRNILNEINITAKIKEHYSSFVNTACETGDDNEYGSTAEADIAALTAISKRIHYGSFYVAESKFLLSPQKYVEAVKNNNENAVRDLLTRREIEEKIVSRVKKKCDKIQSAYTSKLRKKINSELIGNFYKNTIIPLTKDGETEYLFRRCKNGN